MGLLKILTCVIGRIFLSIIFVIAGINKFLNWNSTEQYVLDTLAKWHFYTNNFLIESLMNFMASHIQIFLGIATFLELVGGLLVLIGVFSRIGALMLSVFLIPVTLIMHAFWVISGPEKDIQLVLFMKNIAILGGVFMVAVFGSGFNLRKFNSY